MLSATLLVTVLATQGPAATIRSPYRVSPVADGVSTVGMWSLLGLAEIIKVDLPRSTACAAGRCDPADLNPLDRTVVGNHSAAWRTVSDVGLITTVSASLVLAAADAVTAGGRQPWGDALRDTTVIAESGAVATLLTHVLKYAVRRPRPSQYRGAHPTQSVEDEVSFPSGHATATAAFAAAFATTFGLRHPRSPWRWGVYAAAAVLTGLTAYGRVGGGKHFYTDVLAGALIGTAAGVVVPWLHRRTDASLTPVSSGGVAAQGLSFAMRF